MVNDDKMLREQQLEELLRFLDSEISRKQYQISVLNERKNKLMNELFDLRMGIE
jgi:hypothetical protein